MTPEEIADDLRDKGLLGAADLIERQTKELSECQRHRAQLFDDLNGTPCEQIRHAQEVAELKKALEEAEKALEPFSKEAGEFDGYENDMLHYYAGRVTINDLRSARAALATIRAARGERGDD